MDSTREYKGTGCRPEIFLDSRNLDLFSDRSHMVFFVTPSPSAVLATTKLYQRAIIQAIEELNDFNLRSNIDSIRKRVQSTLETQAMWNDAVFLSSIKSLTNDGSIEALASVNYGLTAEFKRRRLQIARGFSTELWQQQQPLSPSSHRHHEYHDKDVPAKKTEHTKLKIIPKKIFDGMQ